MFKLAQMIMCLPQSASPGQNGTPANRSELEQNIAIRNYLAKEDFAKEAPLFAASTDDVAP
jgi:hypothetical protein